MSKIYTAAKAIIQREPRSWDDAPLWLACPVAGIALLISASFGFVVGKFGLPYGNMAFSMSPEQLADPWFWVCGLALFACLLIAWLFYLMAKGPLAVVRKWLFPV